MPKHINLDELADEAERVRAQVAASPEGGVLISTDFAAFALRWYDTLVQRAEKMAKAAEVVHDAARRVVHGRNLAPRRADAVDAVYRTMPPCLVLPIPDVGDTRMDVDTGEIKRVADGSVCGWVTETGVVYSAQHLPPLCRSVLIGAWQEAVDIARQHARPGVKA